MKSKISPVLLWGLILTVVFGAGFYSGRSNLVEASRTATLVADGGPFKIPTFILGSKAKPKSAESADFDLFWKAWSLLDEKYVATHGVATGTATSTVSPSQARVYGAIKGMVGSLGDPYTIFFDPEEAAGFESQIEGNFSGVGMELGIKDGLITVIAALKSTPAEKAGMRPGDKILQIKTSESQKATNDMPVEEAVKMIRGPKGTTVTFTVLREGVEKPFEVSIVRDTINLPTLDSSYDRATGIFTIKLYSFSNH